MKMHQYGLWLRDHDRLYFLDKAVYGKLSKVTAFPQILYHGKNIGQMQFENERFSLYIYDSYDLLLYHVSVPSFRKLRSCLKEYGLTV